MEIFAEKADSAPNSKLLLNLLFFSRLKKQSSSLFSFLKSPTWHDALTAEKATFMRKLGFLSRFLRLETSCEESDEQERIL